MPNPKLETYKNKATGTVYDYTDAAAQAALADILDGTDIDSFGDVETALAIKVDKVTGKGLSTNDYDDTEKAKVAGAFPRSEQAVLGAKNLLPVTLTQLKTINSSGTWSDNIYTHNGVTYSFEVENDYVKSISTTGTASSGASSLYLTLNLLFKKDVKYIMNGCPNANNDQIWIGVYRSTPTTGYEYFSINGNDSDVFGYSEDTVRAIRIRVGNGANASGLIFKPMIRLASDPDDTYAPYAMTNKELTDEIQNIYSQRLSIAGEGQTTFNIPMKRKNDHRFTFGQITYAAGVWHFLVQASDQSNAVSLTKIIDVANRTVTGSFANDVLSITFSSAINGGIMVDMNGNV